MEGEVMSSSFITTVITMKFIRKQLLVLGFCFITHVLLASYYLDISIAHTELLPGY